MIRVRGTAHHQPLSQTAHNSATVPRRGIPPYHHAISITDSERGQAWPALAETVFSLR